MSLRRVLPSQSRTPVRKLSIMIPTPTVAAVVTVRAAAATPVRLSAAARCSVQPPHEVVDALPLGGGGWAVDHRRMQVLGRVHPGPGARLVGDGGHAPFRVTGAGSARRLDEGEALAQRPGFRIDDDVGQWLGPGSVAGVIIRARGVRSYEYNTGPDGPQA